MTRNLETARTLNRSNPSTPQLRHWLLAATLCLAYALQLSANGPVGGNQDDVPAPDCDPNGYGGLGQPAISTLGPAYTDACFINLLRGSVAEYVVDSTLPGPVWGWSHTRTYDSRLVRVDGLEITGSDGIRWQGGGGGPYFSDTSGTPHLYVNGSTKRIFNASLVAPIDYEATLTKVNPGLSTEEYHVEHTRTGETLKFHGLHANVAAEKQGRLKERLNRRYKTAGTAGIQYTYNAQGLVSQVTTAQGWFVTYTYNTTGTEINRLQKVEVFGVVDGGPYLLNNKTEYTYQGTATSPHADVGELGSLVQVKESTLASDNVTWEERYTQYRYYRTTSTDGKQYQLKMVLEPDAVERIVTAGNTAVDTPAEIMQQADTYVVAGGKTIKDYASRSFTYYMSNVATSSITTPWTASENLESKYGGANTWEYDSSKGHGKVKKVTISGDCGCGGGTGTGVSRSYFYMTLNGGSSTNPAVVTTIVVEDSQDSTGAAFSRKIYGLNTQGVAIREAFVENPLASPFKAWCTSTILNSDRRVTERRMPSAHNHSTEGVTTNAEMAQFLNPSSGTNDADTLNDTTGLVYVTEYSPSTGNIDYIATKAKQGSAGTGYYVSFTKFGDGTNDKPRWVAVETRRYETKVSANPSTSGIPSTYAYTFHDAGDTQIQKRTTTYPAISSGENGSGTSTVIEEYYDTLGRLRWTKDGETYVNYRSYQPDTGGLAYEMTDVNTSSLPADITNGLAYRWLAWSGAAGLTRGATLPTALQLVTKHEFDTFGRETKEIDRGGGEHYTVNEDNRTLRFPYWRSTATERLVPIQVTKTNDGGRVTETFEVDPDRAASTSGKPTGLLTGTDQSHYQTWTRQTYHSVSGVLQQADRYHDIPASGFGTLSTNFYRSIHQYDTRGRQQYEIQVVSGTATSNSREQVTQSVYDVLNRIIEVKKGVSGDSAANQHGMGSSYTSYPTLRSTAATIYDGGGVGDGYATKEKRYHGTGTNDFTGTNYYRNFRGQVRGMEPFYMNASTEMPISPFTVHDIDWTGANTATAQFTSNLTWTSVISNDTYAGSTATNRRTLTKTVFDDLGRVYQEQRYSVSTAGAATNYLKTDYYYDRNNRRVGVAPAEQAGTEIAFDGAGRQYQSRTVSQLETTKYVSGAFQYRDPKPNPSIASVTGGNDLVFSFVHSTLDSFGNTTETHSYEMVHNDTTPVGLDISANQHVRRSVFRWFDLANRVTAEADYGTDDATSGAGSWKYAVRPTRPASAPTVSSDSTLLTKYEYHVDSGRPDKTTIWSTASKAHVTKTFVDDLGRQTFVAENFDNFSPPSSNTGDTTDKSKDKVTAFECNGLDQVAKLIAKDPDADGSSTDDEITLYLFEDTVNASLATNEIYPDSTDTTSAGFDQIAMEYNVDGSLFRRKTQGTSSTNRTIIEHTYNNRRQLEFQKATQLLSGVDNGTLSMKREYDTLARLEKLTSYSDTAGSGTVNNQIQYEYNDLGLVSKSHQSHQNAVVIGTTPNVQYSYDTTMVGNVFTRHHRLQQITNPSGRQTWFGYNEGTTDSVQHRRSLIREIKKGSNGTQYTVYDYNGNGRLVIADYPAPDVKLDYFQGTTGTYACFDRFGRVKDQFWDGYNMTADVSRVKHGYDYAGNRLWREDVIASNNGKDHDEFYSYDGLHRLTNAERGNLNTGYTGLQTKTFGQEWKLDLVGNWDNGSSAAFSQDNDGNGTWELQQTRDHNKANETTTIGAIAGDDWYDPTCATTGNLDTGPKPGAPKDNDANGRKFRYTWDAWNRMVKVEQSPTNASTWTEIAQYEYDGLNQRIVKTDKTSGTVTNDYYYNQEWQVLEVRRGGVAFPFEEFVWHPHYIDALAVRCYDLDVNGSQDEQYCAQDANFNVVAMLGTTGSVIERYQYAAYGSLTVLGEGSDTFAPDLGNLTDIENSCGYTGRELDRETGLCYYRNRNYDCGLGRFVSRDPIVYEGSRSNLYGYVESDPTGSLDPLGLQWHHWFPGGNELWTQISRICRHTPFDRDDYTTWVTGSTGVRGTEHYWIHHDWNYNGRVQNLIDQSNRDCCWLTRRMVDLIWDTWNNMGHQTDDMIIRKYPTRYPNSPELDPGPLFDDLINRNCSGPTPGRRPELPIGPKPELPWWVPSRVEDDWRQNVKILIGAEVIGVPLILGGGAILGGAGAGAGVGRVVVSVGAAS